MELHSRGASHGSNQGAAAVSFLWVEQDGDVVGSEGAFADNGAGSYYGLVVSAGSEAGSKLAGDVVEAGGGVAHDVPGPAGASVAGTHTAGLAGILGSVGDL